MAACGPERPALLRRRADAKETFRGDSRSLAMSLPKGGVLLVLLWGNPKTRSVFVLRVGTPAKEPVGGVQVQCYRRSAQWCPIKYHTLFSLCLKNSRASCLLSFFQQAFPSASDLGWCPGSGEVLEKFALFLVDMDPRKAGLMESKGWHPLDYTKKERHRWVE